MDTLRFSLPPFVRVCWISTAIEGEWRPRLQRVRVALATAWRNAVASGEVGGVLATFSPRDECEVALELAGAACVVIPIRRSKLATQCLLTKASSARQLMREYERDRVAFYDQIGIGACCAASFSVVGEPIWNACGGVDAQTVEVKIDPATNVFLHRLGLGVLPYIPCSLHCETSAAYGKRILDAVSAHSESDVREVLSLGLRWSSLHGIVEMRTTFAKLSHDGIPSRREHVIVGLGRVPQTPTRGLLYPNNAQKLITLGRRLQRETLDSG